MIATAVVIAKSVLGTHGKCPALRGCQTPMLVFDQTKGNQMSLSETWASVYAAFPENAFDYLGHPFYNNNDETIQLWNGVRMVTYAPIPF